MRGTLKIQISKLKATRIIPAHAGNTCETDKRASNAADHPRACGEHAVGRWPALALAGSSPRMRGTQGLAMANRLGIRIIPAHAGNTVNTARPRSWPPDHPRACGEHAHICCLRALDLGSSPRMRGTLQIKVSHLAIWRIIPAHAGNTRIVRDSKLSETDHPRACGEHNLQQVCPGAFRGSSPRMRGTPAFTAPENELMRIIPAHAGNTAFPAWRGSHRSDHPRACGEHGRQCSAVKSPAGSSPRMRGTRVRWRPEPRKRRIIPAHAGNTHPAEKQPYGTADHPRACGEHLWRRHPLPPRGGSSPRMRGTRAGLWLGLRGPRIIPAHAGNTAAIPPAGSRTTDHPRACGEHAVVDMADGHKHGSSPRMRGTRG